MLRDLDQDAGCAPELRERLLGGAGTRLQLRIAVRAVESWLLGDPDGVADWLGIARSVLPRSPESLPDPKAMLIRLAERSRKREVRMDIVPAQGSTARVGRGYIGQILDFASGAWSPARAARACPSLAGARAALQRWRKSIQAQRGR